MSSQERSFGYKELFWSFTGGVVLALVIAAGVALWITNAPIPFVSKVQQSQSTVDEAMLNGKLDPNKKLYADGQGVDPLASIAVPTVKTDDQKANEALEATKFWVHAGSYSQSTDAESMRARIAFIGLDAQITYRNENGQRLYRVRIGPFETEAQANEIKQSLADNSIQGSVIRLKVN